MTAARAALVLAALSAPSAARADEPGGPDRAARIGVGLIGAVGASILTEPDEQSVTVRGVSGRPMTLPDDAGFAGLSGGGGVAFELRAWRYFGLELDLIRARDSGTAELTTTELGVPRTYTLELAAVAWHLPLCVKAVLPTDWVQPFLLVGPELVVPETAEATVTGQVPAGVEYRAAGRSHLMVTAGLGAELLVPIEGLDLRVPLQLRASATPAVGSSRDDRARYQGSDLRHISRVDYATRWQYQTLVTLGALVYF